MLESAAGSKTREIARSLGLREATVSKWRLRFDMERVPGLTDAPRPGAQFKYDRNTERRILTALDNPPPEGYAKWSGKLLSKSLGNVSDDHIWRVLHKHYIHLQRRRSWCVSTDPQFTRKATDIVGLYLEPPENALVICVDEKPSIQALERDQGWLRLPDGKAVRGFSHEYKRHPNVNFHFTPTHASWLNQVECWFSILWRQALEGASFTSARQVRQAIDKYVAVYNPEAAPFEWHKRTIAPTGFKILYADLCK